MPIDMQQCATLLVQEKVRHHLDHEERAIRIAFVTHRYRNLRGEKLAIVRIDAPDDGCRLRVALDRAFACEGDSASLCLAACRLAADTPLVNAEFDADFDNLRMIVEMAVEDGSLTRLQLMSMIDRLVEAAETWSIGIAALRRGGHVAA
jgi:hypothetical protein